MARKLSRIARCGVWLATAALVTTISLRVAAESDVRVSPATEVVKNPFVNRSARGRPVVVAPSTEGEPRTYHNPFSPRGASPGKLTPYRRSGPNSRWRRSSQLPGDSSSSQPGATVDHNVQPAADTWDILTPNDLYEAQQALFGPNNRSAGRGPAAAPDRALFGPLALRQPRWLLPQRRDSSATVEELFRLPTTQGWTAPPAADVRNVADQFRRPRAIRSHDAAPIDPFDSAETSVVEVSDQDAAAAVPAVAAVEPAHSLESITPPPFNAADAAALYLDAQQAAQSAESLKELATVAELCQQALAQRPRRELARSLRSLAAWSSNRRGELESHAGNGRAALAEFDRAIRLDPNCWLALHNRAISRAEQGQAEAALRDFNRVVQLNPGLATVYRNRGELLGAIGRTEEAAADYGRALAQLPEDAELFDMRGFALHRLGRFQEAIQDFNRSIKFGSENAEAYTHRGNVYAELGDFPRALDDLEQAVVLDADYGEAFRNLAWLMATCPDPRFRDPQLALAAAERAAKLAPPGDPFVLDTLAAAYASAGQFERAIRYQTEAMAIAPEDFAPQLAARLALYQQQRPFRDGADRGATEQVRAASLESPVAPPIQFRQDGVPQSQQR